VAYHRLASRSMAAPWASSSAGVVFTVVAAARDKVNEVASTNLLLMLRPARSRPKSISPVSRLAAKGS